MPSQIESRPRQRNKLGTRPFTQIGDHGIAALRDFRQVEKSGIGELSKAVAPGSEESNKDEIDDIVKGLAQSVADLTIARTADQDAAQKQRILDLDAAQKQCSWDGQRLQLVESQKDILRQGRPISR